MSRICPVSYCSSAVAAGKFLCRPHWFALPLPLRDEVWRTYRVIQSAQHRHAAPEQRIADIQAYRAACDAAVAYLDGRQ